MEPRILWGRNTSEIRVRKREIGYFPNRVGTGSQTDGCLQEEDRWFLPTLSIQYLLEGGGGQNQPCDCTSGGGGGGGVTKERHRERNWK